MTDPSPSSGLSAGLSGFDFDALYRGENPAEGVPPITTPPWDTKAPKGNVIAWHEAGVIHDDVLDIGCGLGDNAIYLAQQGYRVTGLDIAPTALITAEHRAIQAGVEIRFATADATRLDGYNGAFDTVIDSGCYHCLDDAGRADYAVAVHRATRPGATLLLSAFSDANAALGEWARPMVSEPQLRQTLGDAGWNVVELTSITMPIGSDQTGSEEATAEMWMLRATR